MVFYENSVVVIDILNGDIDDINLIFDKISLNFIDDDEVVFFKFFIIFVSKMTAKAVVYLIIIILIININKIDFLKLDFDMKEDINEVKGSEKIDIVLVDDYKNGKVDK